MERMCHLEKITIVASLVLTGLSLILFLAYKSIKELTKDMPKEDKY